MNTLKIDTTLKKCEICGKEDCIILGVAASGLGAISHAMCRICAAMGAEPMHLCEYMLSKDPKETYDFCTYDEKQDMYISYQTGFAIPIELKNGKVFQKRDEYIQYVKTIKTSEETQPDSQSGQADQAENSPG